MTGISIGTDRPKKPAKADLYLGSMDPIAQPLDRFQSVLNFLSTASPTILTKQKYVLMATFNPLLYITFSWPG